MPSYNKEIRFNIFWIPGGPKFSWATFSNFLITKKHLPTLNEPYRTISQLSDVYYEIDHYNYHTGKNSDEYMFAKKIPVNTWKNSFLNCKVWFRKKFGKIT